MSSERNSSSSSSSSSDAITSSLRLASNHSFVRDFLTPIGGTSPEALLDSSGGIQRASAVIMNISGISHKIEVGLIPIFSRDSITLGVCIRRDATVCPFAFDNRRTELLIIDEGKIIHVTTEPVRGRRVIQFRTERGNNSIRESVEHHRSISSISEGSEWIENRKRCDGCRQRPEHGCDCRYDSRGPKHPMDFSVFARNVVLFGGSADGYSKTRRRNSWDQRIQKKCDITVTVDERMISQWCEGAQKKNRQQGGSSSSSSRMTNRNHNQFFVMGNNHDHGLEGSQHGNISAGGSGDTGGTLRKIRNRESAARSNQRRKEKLDNLKQDLGRARGDQERLQRRERELREQNLTLKRRVRGRSSKH